MKTINEEIKRDKYGEIGGMYNILAYRQEIACLCNTVYNRMQVILQNINRCQYKMNMLNFQKKVFYNTETDFPIGKLQMCI